MTLVSGNISRWNTGKVVDMSRMFDDASSFNQSINDWDTQNVRFMHGMFSRSTRSKSYDFNQPLNDWNTTNVRNFGGMFAGAGAFNQPLYNWNTTNVLDMSFMFSVARAFNQSLNVWNTTNVLNMRNMFRNADAFDQPLEGWDTKNVKDMRSMFSGAATFNKDILEWSTAANPIAGQMFDNAGAWMVKYRRIDRGPSIDGPPNLWERYFPPLPSGLLFRGAVDDCLKESPVDRDCPGSVYGPMSGWNTSNTTDMSEAFLFQSSFNGVVSSLFASDY